VRIVVDANHVPSIEEAERDNAVRDVEPLARVELGENIVIAGARRVPIAVLSSMKVAPVPRPLLEA
jgi:hypothetical protein